MFGPKVQKDLFEIFMTPDSDSTKWLCQLKSPKMCNQILLDKEDKDFHRLVWKKPPSSPLRPYGMTRNTYGVTPAGFRVIRALLQLAETTKHPAPDTCKSTTYEPSRWKPKHYQMFSSNILLQLVSNFASGPQVILHLSIAFPKAIGKQQTHIDAEENFSKTLGVVWKPKHDTFTYNVNPSEGSPQTKRQIISKVSRIFNPLGRLSPIVIQLKSSN